MRDAGSLLLTGNLETLDDQRQNLFIKWSP